MASSDFAIGMIFLSQTLVGTLGNFFLLYHYTYLELTRYTVRPTDLILRHLTVANSLVLLSKGVPQTMTAFGLKHFLGDVGCKLVFYVHKVGRGVCIGNTCLLSVFQAIMISPTDSWWAALKLQTHKFVGPSNVLCWILNLLVGIIVPVSVTHKGTSENNTRKLDLGYCYGVVITFVSFYTSSHILILYMVLFHNPSWWLVSTSALITAGFPTVSPFVLMIRERRILRVSSTCPRKSPLLHDLFT